MKKIFTLILSLCFFVVCTVSCATYGGDDGYTKGLEYTLYGADYGADENGEGGVYGVSGIGTATDKEIVIPPTYNDLPVGTIDGWVFENNTHITSVTIFANGRENGLYCINMYAFSGCTSLKEVNILGGGNLSIADSAFSNCSSLVKVKADLNISYTGIVAPFFYSNAFQNCVSLEEIIISEIDIYENAFNNCPNLKSVYFYGTEESWKNMKNQNTFPRIYNEGNKDLLNAQVYFYSEEKPEDTTNKYWHYVDGEAVMW